RFVKALGQGVATGTDWRLTADTIHLTLERRKLQHAFAWSRGDSTSHARAVSTLNTIDADSLALDTPDEVLTEARAFRHAFSTSKKDSSKTADVDWIAGDTLTAHWTQVADSGAAPTGSTSSPRRPNPRPRIPRPRSPNPRPRIPGPRSRRNHDRTRYPPASPRPAGAAGLLAPARGGGAGPHRGRAGPHHVRRPGRGVPRGVPAA